jgi:hypothetical protein
MMNKNTCIFSRDNFQHVVCGCALFVSCCLAAQSELSFETLGSLRMRSLGLNLHEDDKPQRLIKDPKVALSVQLSSNDKRRLVYTLCAQDDARRGIMDNEDLKMLFNDLEFFCGNGADPQETLFNTIYGDRLRTTFGEAMAAKRLAAVVTDKERLVKFQSCVRAFASDKMLSERVDALLCRLAREESNVLSFWAPFPMLTQRLINQLYFGVMFPCFFNKNAAMLEALTWLNKLSAPFMLTADFALAVGAIYFANRIFKGESSLKEAIGVTLDFSDPRRAIREFRYNKTADAYAERDRMIMGIALQTGQVLTEAQRAERNKQLRFFSQVMACFKFSMSVFNIGMKVNMIRMFIDDLRQRACTMRFLQERLISVAEYIRVLHELYNLAQEYPVIAQALPVASVYDNLRQHQSPEVRQLITLLETRTFDGKASLFSNSGRILVAHALMNGVKNELIGSLQLLGDLDACCALSKLYKMHEGQRVGYAFAQYEQADAPHIKIDGLWHPFVDQEDVVENSVELGSPFGSERGMILTGSNKGGKSTLLKAMMINVVLAQTITLVPANFYSATPFNYVVTYMNVADDTAAGQSLFQAQVLRAKKLVESIDSLANHNIAFVVIDEIFTGTNARSSSQAAYKLAQHLANSTAVCFVIATHYVDELAALEQETKGICKNYNVDADKDEHGNITFTYRLRPGYSTQNIAVDILNAELHSVRF